MHLNRALGAGIALAGVLLVGCAQQDRGIGAEVDAAAGLEGQVKPTPKEVVGITVGKPLGLPRCSHRWPEKASSRCWTSDVEMGATLQEDATVDVELPDGELPSGILAVQVVMLDGKVYDITLTTMDVFQRDLLAMLAAKWGTPSQSNVAQLQNGFGAQSESLEAQWLFSDMRVSFFGRTTGTDGTITFQTLPRPEQPKAPQGI